MKNENKETALLTGYMFADANRRAAVWNCLAVDLVEPAGGGHVAR